LANSWRNLTAALQNHEVNSRLLVQVSRCSISGLPYLEGIGKHKTDHSTSNDNDSDLMVLHFQRIKVV
jgi:hypothetical protein